MSAPAWWPPEVGAKLRGYHGPDGRRDPLIRVVAVFEHAGEHRIVAAEWVRTRRRWIYEVHDRIRAEVGLIRPDGTPRLPR